MKEFDINKYAKGEMSFSFGKNLDGDFAPNRCVWDRKHPGPKKSYHTEGKIIECAIIYPDKFDSIYKVSNIKTDNQEYKFSTIFHRAKEEKGWNDNRALAVAKRVSGMKKPPTIKTILGHLEGKWKPLVKHYIDFKGFEPISKSLYNMAMRHQERVWEEKNKLHEFLTDTRVQIEPHLHWKNLQTDVRCHGYPDISIPNEVKIDIKSLISAQSDDLMKRYGPIRKFKMAEQLAAYSEAELNQEGTRSYIYVAEKHALANWNMFRISDYDMVCAYENFSRWCQAFKFINENNLWHLGYQFSALYEFDQSEQEFIQKTKVPIIETTLFY